MYQGVHRPMMSVFRFESLEPEINSQASRVAAVNQIASQLSQGGHPSEREIKIQQDKLNTRSNTYTYSTNTQLLQTYIQTDLYIADVVYKTNHLPSP